MKLHQQLGRLLNQAKEYDDMSKRFAMMADEARQLHEYMSHPTYSEDEGCPITWDEGGRQKIDMAEMDKRQAMKQSWDEAGPYTEWRNQQ